MRTSDEKKILNTFKLGPLGVLLFTIIITSLLVIDDLKNLNHELNSFEEQYIQNQKDIIKKEVNRVYKYIEYKKENAENKLKESLKNRVYEAHSIATNLYNKYKNTKTQQEITDIIKEALRDIRFNDNRGYYYILTTKDATNILNGFQPRLEGKQLYDLQDSKGKYLNREIIKVIKTHGEGYIDYFWYKPGTNGKMFQKFTFSKEFQPYGFYIGTGEYLIDFEKNLKKEILDYVSTIKYGSNGYIFINHFSGVNLAHIKKSFRGMNFNDLKDSSGVYSVKELNKIAKQGEGYLEYVGEIVPSSGKKGKKISFAKGFLQWEWTIGSGAYLVDMNTYLTQKELLIKEQNKNQVIKLLVISFFVILIFFIIATLFSKKVGRMFKSYSKKIETEIIENNKKEKFLFQQSKMASIGEMLENIAHQWRQPLSIITTSSTGMKLKKEISDLSDDEFKEYVDTITNEAQNLSKTIDEFSNMFNVTNEQFVTNSTVLIHRVISVFSNNINNQNIEVIETIKNLDFLTQEKELFQVLIKIILNALDALNKINSQKYIFINFIKISGNIKIEIKDNAGGIDESIITRIFEPYFTTHHQSQGKGLGLYVAHEVVTNTLKGDITVDNETYIYHKITCTGAKFTITIPFKA